MGSQGDDDPYQRAWESKSRFSRAVWEYTGVVVKERPEPGDILSPKGVLVTAVFLAVLAGVVVAVVLAGANAQPRAGDPPPEAVVQGLADAWSSRDCEAMEDVTVSGFRDSQGWSDCSTFEASTALPEGGESYPVGAVDVTVEGRSATVWACDRVPAPEEWSCIHYDLEYSGWAWRVVHTRR